jgi:hypothetical protein
MLRGWISRIVSIARAVVLRANHRQSRSGDMEDDITVARAATFPLQSGAAVGCKRVIGTPPCFR